jgi:hypothetical protein
VLFYGVVSAATENVAEFFLEQEHAEPFIAEVEQAHDQGRGAEEPLRVLRPGLAAYPRPVPWPALDGSFGRERAASRVSFLFRVGPGPLQ